VFFKKVPPKIVLISYPKIVFLYPTALASLGAAIYLSFAQQSLDTTNTAAIVLSVLFLGVWAANQAVLAFDFPRASSLVLLLLFHGGHGGCAVVGAEARRSSVGGSEAQDIPSLGQRNLLLDVCISLGLAILGAMLVARFDRWEARPNQLLHHQGLWGDLDRFPAPGTAD
jgi:hypothetical protein